MKITNIIHQQIAQLKWHILACFGLVMVLPLENAFVNFFDGDGFYDDRMFYAGMLISIFLSGLIASSNIQADFKQTRYTFWRSKPVNATLFIILKFFTGLSIAIFIVACPFLFGLVTTLIQGEEFLKNDSVIMSIIFATLALLAYAFCFASNILVRKTARSWLIGITLTCLTLLLPFILPFNYSLSSDRNGFFFIKCLFAVIAGGMVFSFVFAVLAAGRNWHLKTNLKGLLWVGAALLISLMLLFSTQVANIRVLDEKESQFASTDCLSAVDGRVMLADYGYVDVTGGKINLQPFDDRFFKYIKTRPKGKDADEYIKASDNKGFSWAWAFRRVFYMLDGEIFQLKMMAYYEPEKRADGKETRSRNYKKLFLLRRRLADDGPYALTVLDLSDFLQSHGGSLSLGRVLMRRFDNKLVLCIGDKLVEVDLSMSNKLEISNKHDLVTTRGWIFAKDNKEYRIPLLPVEGIGPVERIKSSIDYHIANILGDSQRSFNYSCVDIHNDKIAFIVHGEDNFTRCEVTRWDDKSIYFKITAVRDFTILENTFGSNWWYHTFVKDGRFYAWSKHDLLVFDIRSSGGIRKLGHFIRAQTEIEDVLVLDDGNILLALEHEKIKNMGDMEHTLALLKKP